MNFKNFINFQCFPIFLVNFFKICQLVIQVLSNMLVNQVYNLDPDAFPLDKPTEKNRRIKGRKAKAPEPEPSQFRSISEDPTKSTINLSPNSPPGGDGATAESEHESSNSQATGQSETGSTRIKRAYSDADIEPPVDETQETG